MSYVDEHLLPGERVVYRARQHWSIFGWSITLTLLGIAIFAILQLLDLWPEVKLIVPLLLFAIAAVLAIAPALRYIGSEYAVTDKRVVVKLGLIQRESDETLLSKVEAIGVDQSIWGRMFGFGTVTIVGTGGTRETFTHIAGPLEFRRQVQGQIVAGEDRRGGGAVPLAPSAATEERIERECPFCAERILAKARVCKHCGREVAAP
jgi:membrane protein YdbS with pleckstrin-like domain